MGNSEIIKLSAVEHLLTRPGMYIGNVSLVDSSEFVYENDKIFKKEIEYVPAFIKIFREILDNAVDENIRTNGKFANKIEIEIDQNKMMIIVKDNGRGLSSDIDKDYHVPKAVLAITESLAGSNFNDDTNTIGQNGVGAFGCAVFSKYFELDTSDGSKRTRLICKNNLSKKDYTQTKCSNHFTKIKFSPDFQKLSMTFINDIHYNMIYKNILDLSVAFPNIKFYFNNKLIKNKNFREYVKLYADNFEIFSSENCDVAVIHSQELDQVSFVNGIYTKNGGTHVDHISNCISYNLRDILVKKYKSLKPLDVKNNCFFIINIKNMVAPRFDSQLKENLTNPFKDVYNMISDLDLDAVAKSLSKSKNIVDPIIETFKLKEELRKRAELRDQEKKVEKRKVVPKLIEANSRDREKCTLFLAEGDSAIGAAIGVRTKYQAFYPISGKFVNCYDLSPGELIKKKSVSELLSIIGLKLSSPNIDNLNYGKICLLMDSDTDGDCITALMINFFFKYWPDLIENKKLYKAESFLILGKNIETGKEKKFYSLEEFDKVKEVFKLLEYNKGLGSLSEDEYKETINSLICITNNDKLAKEKLEIAFSKSGNRKTWMLKEE